MDYHNQNLINILRRHHNIFYRFWITGKPIFVDDGSIRTSAVGLDRTGKRILYYWEKSFWETLSVYERAFVVCHEMMHIILYHLLRGKDLEHKEIANHAMDCVINEMLINDFGFNKKEISFFNTLSTFDKIFDDPKYTNLDRTESFEYYYKLLLNDPETLKNKNISEIDNHAASAIFSEDDLSDIIEENNSASDIKDIGKTIGNQEKKEIHIRKAGKQQGTTDINLKPIFSKESRGWMKAIRKWSDEFIEENFEQWIKPNRRLQELPDGIFLPSYEQTEDIKSMPFVWVFWDISDSCRNIVEDFRKAVLSIPQTKFKLKYFVFDTTVKEINPRTASFKGFGGTNFNCIEEVATNAKKYPDHIWVITDGESSMHTPKYPERYTFFLGGDYITRSYIPAGCNIFELKDIV